MDKIIAELSSAFFATLYENGCSEKQAIAIELEISKEVTTTLSQVRRDAVEECIKIVDRCGSNYHRPKPKDYINMFQQLLTDMNKEVKG